MDEWVDGLKGVGGGWVDGRIGGWTAEWVNALLTR